MKLKQQLAKVKLVTRVNGADKTYEWDDKQILSRSVSLGEQERSSSCAVTIYDPSHTIVNQLIEKLEGDGGFLVPQNLFSDQSGEASSTGSASSGDLSNVQEGITGDELSAQIVSYAKSVGVTDLAHIAYILATAQHESGMGTWLEEIPYDDGGSGYEYLGAGETEFHGRGLVMTTWRSGYEKTGKLLGVDLVSNPDLLKELRYAIPALVLGMKTGLYSGYKLDDFS